MNVTLGVGVVVPDGVVSGVPVGVVVIVGVGVGVTSNSDPVST